MKLLEKMAITTGLIVVGITALYRYVLTDEQRAAMREASDVVKESMRDVTDSIAPLVKNGPTKREEEAMIEANRARTAAQWETLGY